MATPQFTLGGMLIGFASNMRPSDLIDTIQVTGISLDTTVYDEVSLQPRWNPNDESSFNFPTWFLCNAKHYTSPSQPVNMMGWVTDAEYRVTIKPKTTVPGQPAFEVGKFTRNIRYKARVFYKRRVRDCHWYTPVHGRTS